MNFNFQVNSRATYALFFPFIISNYMKTKKDKSSMKCHEEPADTELPINNFDVDDPEFEQLQQILNDPNLDPEMYKELMLESKNFGIQPMKFNQLHSGIKNDLDDDMWSGLRLGLNWKPTNIFNSETLIDIDGNLKGLSKYRISATTIIPGNTSII